MAAPRTHQRRIVSGPPHNSGPVEPLIKRTERLFFQISKLPRAEQSAALESACADDPELHAEVASLLAAAPDADYLDEPALGTDFRLLQRAEAEDADALLGK